MEQRGASFKISRKLSPQEAAKKADNASLSIRKLKKLRPAAWPPLVEISNARKEAEASVKTVLQRVHQLVKRSSHSQTQT